MNSYGLQPLGPASTLSEKMYKVPAAEEFYAQIEQGLGKARKHLAKAADNAKYYADAKRRHA